MLRVKNKRFALLEKSREKLIGLLIASFRGEPPQGFAREFGSVYDRKEIVNIEEFPELAEMDIFAIEYLSPGELDDLTFVCGETKKL